MRKSLIFTLLWIILISTSTWGSETERKVYFSTKDNLSKIVLSELAKAEKSIHIAMYYFTFRPLAKGLIKAKRRNMEIKVLLDEGQKYSKSSCWDLLVEEGIKVKFYKSPGLMYNKFCVIDEKITLTGSYNWTGHANKINEENLIAIDSEEVAKQYKKEFQNLWAGPGIIKTTSPENAKYVGNRNSRIFHRLDCYHVKRTKETNKVYFADRKKAIKAGFRPCKICKP